MLVGVCAFFVSMTGGIQTEKTFRYRLHQDTNLLSVVCQHEVEGLEMQTRNDKWVLIKPSPTSLVSWSAMPWAWANERTISLDYCRRDISRYSAMLFLAPKLEGWQDFIRFCVSEEGARQEDKLKAYCGV